MMMPRAGPGRSIVWARRASPSSWWRTRGGLGCPGLGRRLRGAPARRGLGGRGLVAGLVGLARRSRRAGVGALLGGLLAAAASARAVLLSGRGLAGSRLGALRLARLAGRDASLGGLRRGGLAGHLDDAGHPLDVPATERGVDLEGQARLARAAAFGWMARPWPRGRAPSAPRRGAAAGVGSGGGWRPRSGPSRHTSSLRCGAAAGLRGGAAAWRTLLSPDGVRAPVQVRGVLAKGVNLECVVWSIGTAARSERRARRRMVPQRLGDPSRGPAPNRQTARG